MRVPDTTGDDEAVDWVILMPGGLELGTSPLSGRCTLRHGHVGGDVAEQLEQPVEEMSLVSAAWQSPFLAALLELPCPHFTDLLVGEVVRVMLLQVALLATPRLFRVDALGEAAQVVQCDLADRAHVQHLQKRLVAREAEAAIAVFVSAGRARR